MDTYADSTGSDTCTACPTGTYADSTGSDTCTSVYEYTSNVYGSCNMIDSAAQCATGFISMDVIDSTYSVIVVRSATYPSGCFIYDADIYYNLAINSNGAICLRSDVSCLLQRQET